MTATRHDGARLGGRTKTIVVWVNFYGGKHSFQGVQMGWKKRLEYIASRILLLGDDVHVDTRLHAHHYACLRGRGNVMLSIRDVDHVREAWAIDCEPQPGPGKMKREPKRYPFPRTILRGPGLLPKRAYVWNCVQATAHYIGLTERVRTPRQLRRAIRTRGDRDGWIVLIAKDLRDRRFP